MAAFLGNLRNVVIVSFILAIIFIAGYFSVYGAHADLIFWQAVFRWLHVIFGIMWIGLLWYFNFVQTRMMPQIPAELRPAVSKYIAPEALFWFRWAAAFTWLMGVILAWSRGFLLQAYTLGAYEPGGGAFSNKGHILIGVGMWLGTIMAFNVWVFIWPNQKKVLGLVEADDAAKAAAGRIAGQASRINTLLSIPMLVAMTMQQTLIG
ncbi:MAG TPA: urate hydroxylase PuuD [Caulobacteraceae bacterium]|nr:urate hydroxylase PuuD [Caulobacteraceae bacterium]